MYVLPGWPEDNLGCHSAEAIHLVGSLASLELTSHCKLDFQGDIYLRGTGISAHAPHPVFSNASSRVRTWVLVLVR